MKLLVEWEKGSLILEPEYTYVLGRDESSDIYIDSPRISRAHARLSFKGKDWIFEDLDSSNGTFSGKEAIKVIKINKDLSLDIGGIDNYKIQISVLKSFTTNQKINTQETKINKVNFQKNLSLSDDISRIRLKKRIRIGRDETNDWVLTDPNVSRNHAEILQNSGGHFEIVDLRSMNGTYVNGQKVKREPLRTGDTIRIGQVEKKFTLDGLETIEGISGTDILVKNVSFEIKGKKLLDDISFKLGPRTLTAVIGPSGAGKSTLLGVLNGRTKPSSGDVLIGGVNLHENFQAAIQRIGLVPQSDILHTNLTVNEALSFGARLRLPDDMNKSEREEQVDLVLEKLELTERRHLRIDKLSGGQRKRASIGLELLTAPDILCLDEPTSGLDPGLDAHVMQTLRTLADDGQTVVVVTHSVDNLDICDNVILMASGGHIAYCGPASSVFSQLGKKSWAEVFRFLASEEAINLVSQKHLNPVTTELSEDHIIVKNKNSIKQCITLSHRYLKVIGADRFYTTLLLLIPIIIGLIAHLAGSDYGFGKGQVSDLGISANPYARGSILVLILGSVFVGLATGIQEIVKENQIRIREQAVGVKPINYLVSKLIVLGLIVLIQMIVFVQIVLFGRPLPDKGLLVADSRVEITAICSLLALSAMVMGLFISSLISSTEQAMPALVGMTMIQVVLSGAMPLETGGLIDKFSSLSPSYWANNALSASVDLVQISRITDSLQQDHWRATSENLLLSLSIILSFMISLAFLSWVRIRKSR